MAEPTPPPPSLWITPTPTVVTLDGVPCRVWSGHDAHGRQYDVYVHRVGTADAEGVHVLEGVLKAEPPPKRVVDVS